MLFFMADNHTQDEAQDNNAFFSEYALDIYQHEVFERATRNLRICTTTEEMKKVVDTLFTGLGQPGFFKLKNLDNHHSITFGRFKNFSSSKKILDIVRRHEGILSRYCDHRAIFNNTPHLLYLIDIEKLEDTRVTQLNDNLMLFSQEVSNWIEHQNQANK